MKRALVSLAICLSLSQAMGQSGGKRCGGDRWPIKTLTDGERHLVKLSPVPTTIAELMKLPAPLSSTAAKRRIAPAELTVYRVRAILHLSLKHDRDSDLHLFLSDPAHPEAMMIAEIPAPECAAGSGHENDYRRARAVVKALRPNTLVEIEGVGFFDSAHDMPLLKGIPVGPANGFELHPVLRVRPLDPND